MLRTTGATFDHYVIEGEIGHGGMGRVYRARDTRRDTPIALKLLDTKNDAKAGDVADARARLSREATAAASFDHPNAVTIYEAGEWEGTAFIAMELVDGESLRALIRRGDLPPWPERLRWLTDAARALAASHAAGLVHRDVKPENVMLTSDGRIKVLDFGIARRAWAAGATRSSTGNGVMRTITAPNQLVGTPQYMAPEYILGEMLDGRADQFAWGVMAHELLVGKPPWDGTDTIHVMAAVLNQEVEPLRRIERALPDALDDAVRRCLSKAPSDRFPNMDELVEELDAIAEQNRLSMLPASSLPALTADAPSRASIAPASTESHPRSGPRAWQIVLVIICASLGAIATYLYLAPTIQR